SPLRDQGSRSAPEAGLFHETTLISQQKEAASQVDIGAHYVALLPPVVQDTVWVEDSVPSGASTDSDGGDSWNWVSANPAPFHGQVAHQSSLRDYEHQHFFYYANPPLSFNAGDSLFCYVYLDPNHLPSEVMLQCLRDDDTWDH